LITEVQARIEPYLKACNLYGTQPTVKGLSNTLGINERTLYRVIHGEYAKGKPYTSRPHPNRAIDNRDFALLESVFTKYSDHIRNTKKG
jgi:hypothetical protein